MADTRPGEIFIQYKGTDICFDFYCECGAQGHFDGYFAQNFMCGKCSRLYSLPACPEIKLIAELTEEDKKAGGNGGRFYADHGKHYEVIEMDSRWKE